MARTNKIIEAAKKLKPVTYAEYKDLVADNIIALVLNGLSVAAACKQVGIERANVSHWAAENTTFAQHLARAREQAAFFLAENSVEVAHDKTIDPHRARNIISAQQWLASKYNAKQFGDKQQIQITQTHENMLEQLELPPHMKSRVIDITPDNIETA